MKPRASPSKTPSVSVALLTDPTAVSNDMEVLDQDVISLDKRPFLAQQIMVRLEGSVLLFQQTHHRMRSYTKLDPNYLAFFAIGPRAKGIVDGIMMRPDTLITAKPGTEAELVVEAGYSSVTLLVPPKDLFGHLSARGRSSEFHMPNGIEIMNISQPVKGAFFKLGKRISQTAKRNPSLFRAYPVKADTHYM